MPESDAESGARTVRLHESWEEQDQRIESEFESRLVLFCESCNEMTRYTSDSLTWYCSECGGGDLTTERVKELLERDL